MTLEEVLFKVIPMTKCGIDVLVERENSMVEKMAQRYPTHKTVYSSNTRHGLGQISDFIKSGNAVF